MKLSLKKKQIIILFQFCRVCKSHQAAGAAYVSLASAVDWKMACTAGGGHLMAVKDAQCVENSCTCCDVTDVVSHWEIVAKSDAQRWNLLNSRLRLVEDEFYDKISA